MQTDKSLNLGTITGACFRVEPGDDDMITAREQGLWV